MMHYKRIVSLLLTTVLMSYFLFATASAAEIKPSTDPYYDFHLNISYTVDALRADRSAQIEPLQSELLRLYSNAKELYEERMTFSLTSQKEYTILVNEIKMLNAKIQEIHNEYFDNVKAFLHSQGFIDVESDAVSTEIFESFHLSATDAGYMQTNSFVQYHPELGEFYYFVEYDYNQQNLFGAYVGLNDSMGDYDLVSMQHKENDDWSWNNIIVSADLGIGFAGTTLAGKADKYRIIDNGLAGARAVSNRNDFWNGCIFNIKDDEVSAHQTHSSEIRYVTLEGWLQPDGSQKTCLVKSEYEHNYKKAIWDSVSIGSALLDDLNFSMNVTYTAYSGSWSRSAGSRVCVLPN